MEAPPGSPGDTARFVPDHSEASVAIKRVIVFLLGEGFALNSTWEALESGVRSSEVCLYLTRLLSLS